MRAVKDYLITFKREKKRGVMNQSGFDWPEV
jgi:hypothetical protein